MMSRSGILVAALLAAAASALAPAAFAKDGRIHHMTGQVWVNDKLATPETEVTAGDKIRTGKGSSVQVVMNDRTLLDITPDTTFQIEAYNYGGPKSKKNRSVFNILRGTFRYISGLMAKANHRDVSIRAGTVATIGIRGSAATVQNLEDVSVQSGIGTTDIKLTVDGKETTISLTPGQASKGQNVVPKGFDNVMTSVTNVLNNPTPAAMSSEINALGDVVAQTVAVAAMTANMTNMGMTPDQIGAALAEVAAANPALAPAIVAASTAMAPESMQTFVDAVSDVEGVDTAAVGTAATNAQSAAEAAEAAGPAPQPVIDVVPPPDPPDDDYKS